MATKSSIAKQQPSRTAKINKQNEPGTPPRAPKPAWTPPGTPRSFHKEVTPREDGQERGESDDENEPPSGRSQPKSPRLFQKSPRSRVHFKADGDKDGEAPGGLNADLAEREIARQAWLDSEVSRRVRCSSPWGGGTLIHSCVIILKQAITDPPLNKDILNMKL